MLYHGHKRLCGITSEIKYRKVMLGRQILANYVGGGLCQSATRYNPQDAQTSVLINRKLLLFYADAEVWSWA
jgi:hypothetical protein